MCLSREGAFVSHYGRKGHAFGGGQHKGGGDIVRKKKSDESLILSTGVLFSLVSTEDL